MKVEIWSDFTCPYCYLGKRRLERALSELPFADEVEVEWLSFEINPETLGTSEKTKVEHLADKYDQPEKWAELLCLSLTEQGQEIDIKFDFANNKVSNTYDAHRLLQLAKSQNKADELNEQLLFACFTEGKSLADHKVLIDCSEKVGLNSEEVNNLLADSTFSDEVTQDKTLASEIGIQSAPFFIIDEAFGMEGAQPVEHIKKMLTDVYQNNLSVSEG